MRLRPRDHLVQRALGGRQLALRHQERRRDPQILGLPDCIEQPTAKLLNAVELAPRPLQLAAGHSDLRTTPERQRPECTIPVGVRQRDGTVGRRQRPVERPLLPVRDRLVVEAFGDAPLQAGALEGGRGDLPGPDRLRMPSPQVTDDPQIVGAAGGSRGIPVPAGG